MALLSQETAGDDVDVQELISGKHLRPPATARGVYLDDNPRQRTHMRFTHALPDRWVWLHHDGAPSGAISDGTTHVIVEDGVAALVTDEGEVSTSHRLLNLLNPHWFGWQNSDVGEVREGVVIDRAAWLGSATSRPTDQRPEPVPFDFAFDQGSGVLLYMKSADSFLGFQELFLNEPIDEEAFRWSGPHAPRPIGSALVIPEEDGGYSVTWEVAIKDRGVYHYAGPVFESMDETFAWGEARASSTELRDS